MNQKLINLPQEYSLSAYEQAVDDFVKKYSSHPEVLAIYQFGDVTVPGISDLDFIIVLNKSLSIPFGEEFSIQSFDDDLRYLYNDTQPFLMTADIFKDFWKIFPILTPKLLYGTKQKITEESRGDASIYHLLSLIDICNYFYPIIFLEQLYSKNLNVRRSLLILNALRFPLDIMSSIVNKKIDRWEKFIEAIRNLRSGWFKSNEKERIIVLGQLLEEAPAVSIDLISKLSNHIQNNLWSIRDSRKDIAGRLFAMDFTNQYDPAEIYKGELEYYQRENRWISLLPASFFFPLMRYSKNRGPVGRHIKKNLIKGDIIFDCFRKDVFNIIDKRSKIMNQHAAFYLKNKIGIPMVHNYYSYDPSMENTEGLFLSMLKKIM